MVIFQDLNLIGEAATLMTMYSPDDVGVSLYNTCSN